MSESESLLHCQLCVNKTLLLKMQVLFKYDLPPELRNIIMKNMVKTTNRSDFISPYLGCTKGQICIRKSKNPESDS